MQISQIAGFLGCGKTTLLLVVSKKLAAAGSHKVALVVNEIGEIPVDGKVIEESGIRMKDIGGGCICCEVASSFAKTVYGLYREFKPDHILVEPTGVAVPHQVKIAARMAGRDAKVSMGPAIVLFDATRPAELMDMEMLGRLVVTQLEDADVVAVSKVDLVEQTAIEDSIKRIRQVNETAEIIKLSSFTGLGVDELIERIISWKEK
jgi:G3E family GTPase